MPLGLVYAFGGDRSLQVWYRDSTLRMLSPTAYRAHPEIPVGAWFQFEPGHRHDLVLIPAPAILAQERAFLLLRDQHIAEALALYTRADSLDTDSLAYIFHAGNAGGRAFALGSMGRLDEAEAQARLGYSLYAGDVNARLVLADRAMGHGRFDEADRLVESVLMDDPNQRSALLLRETIRQVRAGSTPGPGH